MSNIIRFPFGKTRSGQSNYPLRDHLWREQIIMDLEVANRESRILEKELAEALGYEPMKYPDLTVRCTYCNAPDNGTCAYPSEGKCNFKPKDDK